MTFKENAAQRWYQFPIFKDVPGLVQGIFTRQGGVSPEPWSSLNMATSVGDLREHVIENRRRITHALGLEPAGIYDVWQVHGTQVIHADQPRGLDTPHKKADAIITDRSGVAILMLFADCVPILLYDPIRRVIGMAHAGWQGTVKRVAAEAIHAMKTAHGSNPKDLLAGIGPSICAQHYQVGMDVIGQVEQAFGHNPEVLTARIGEKAQLDLWQANRQILIDCGLPEDHIEVAGVCTAEHPQDWYSHRGEQGKTGRFAAVLALND